MLKLVCLFVLVSASVMQAKGKKVYVCEESINGNRWVYFLTEERLEKMPVWIQEKQHAPPVSIGDAISAALSSEKAKAKKYNRNDLYSVKLTSSISINGKRRWMYEILFFDADRSNGDDVVSVMVMMDGKTLSRMQSKKWYAAR